MIRIRETYTRGALLLASSLILFACGEAAPAATAGVGGDQVATGQKLYGAHCASCHGDSGQGAGKSPPVVGKTALPLDAPPASTVRKGQQFHTAKDVYDFVKAKMPMDSPGSLKDDEYWAILAFDLKANGVDLGGKTVDASTASSFVLHP